MEAYEEEWVRVSWIFGCMNVDEWMNGWVKKLIGLNIRMDRFLMG